MRVFAKGEKININNWLIINPFYIDHYDSIFEEPDIMIMLEELEGEQREEFIKLEEQQNPVHFKAFREEFPEYFE